MVAMACITSSLKRAARPFEICEMLSRIAEYPAKTPDDKLPSFLGGEKLLFCQPFAAASGEVFDAPDSLGDRLVRVR
jgi:hypothetical protein